MDTHSMKPKKRKYKLYLEPSSTNNLPPSKTTEWRWEKQLKLRKLSTNGNGFICDDNNDATLGINSPTTSTGLNDGNHNYELETDIVTPILAEEFNISDGELSVNSDFIDNPRNHNETDVTVSNMDDDDYLMFREAGLTKKAVQMMVLGISLRHNLSNKAREDILELIRICGNLRDNTFSTNYAFAKKFDPPDNTIKYVFYCNNCNSPLTSLVTKLQYKEESKQCPNCESTQEAYITGTNHFILTDISYPLKMILQNRRLFNMIMAKTNTKSLHISDVYDGEIYKKLKKNAYFDLSYSFNIDGAPIFGSSKKSMWPIQIIINELPPQERFKHLIFGGIWIGNKEPKSDLMNTIFKSFAENAKRLLNEGIVVINPNNGSEMTIKLIPLLCCVDSVARPVLQCRKQFNGYFGCSWCYQSGTSIKKQIKYPFENNVELRTAKTHMDDLVKVAANHYTAVEHGVKGPSSLSLLPHFDIVWSLPVDYMHGVLLGVVRQLCDLWTTYSLETKHTHYIGYPAAIKKLNERLLSIKPTQNIHRLPRAFNDRAKWKASEWKSWLLYFALPCLNGILKSPYLNNFALLVNAIYLLLQEKISREDVILAENTLHKFVKDIEKLYGVAAMTFNMHTLLHITESVRQAGPLWASSAFPYESGIYRIKQQVKGPVGVEKQITKKMMTLNTFLYSIEESHFNDTCINFCTNIFHIYKPIVHNSKSDEITFIGSGYILNNADICKYSASLDFDLTDALPTHWFSYNKCIFKKVMFHSKEYMKAKKTKDTIVQTKSGQFGQILKFIKCNFGNYIWIKIYKTECEIYGETVMPNLQRIISNGSKCSLIPISDIKMKCMLLKVNENKYICMFANTFEIQ